MEEIENMDMHGDDRILPEFDSTDDGDSSEEENDNEMTDVLPSGAGTSKPPTVRFSRAQKACLESYYKLGMNSIGRSHSLLIAKAAADTHLTAIHISQGMITSDYYDIVSMG